MVSGVGWGGAWVLLEVDEQPKEERHVCPLPWFVADHISGYSLDPVVTDLPPDTVQCEPLDFVGTSDHAAVLTKVHFRRPREERYTRTLWR